MADENYPNESSDNPPIPEQEPPESQDAAEESSPRPVSRLDRLMGAKDKADKEASRWHEIEAMGQPVPSQDQEDPGVTQPVIPAESFSDLPTDVIEKAEPPEAPKAPAPEMFRRQPVRGPQETPPPFPHPTDVPAAPPSRPEQAGFPHPTTPPEPEDVTAPPDLFVEPPQPDDSDDYAPSRGVPRQQPPAHHRYQPSPDKLEDVRVDDSGMPLPRRVAHEDPEATMVGPSAYNDRVEYSAPPTEPHGIPRPEIPTPQREYVPDAAPASVESAPPPAAHTARAPISGGEYQQTARRQPTQRKRKRRRKIKFSWGCVVRATLLSLVGGIVILMLAGGGAAIYYSQVTAPSFQGINDITDLQERALQFQTTRIRDREGNILYEINDPNGGFRDYVTLEEMSPWVIVATVSTEERDFFTNPGFSIPAIIRAAIQNLREGEIVSGASTITQQLVEALLLPEEQRMDQSYATKLQEVFLAAELGRRFEKEEILELYLNQIYYGNLAYGIEAAAQTYFNKHASELTLAEASFLAGLPQAPVFYDPVLNLTGTVHRQQQVLSLMLEAECLNVGSSLLQLPCIRNADIAAAQEDLIYVATREYQAPAIQARYPHWVVYIQQQLEADPAIGPAIYTSGFDVYTTLDPRVQDLAQAQVESALAQLVDRNVNNASVVVIDVNTGAILGMVGSRDFNDESIDGQVNIALTPQQPGSSIKPFTYLAAFRQGWSPATVIWDVPIEYEIPGFGVYAPVNYDGGNWGPVTVRQAIANSLNIPAVVTLDYVGVPALLEVLNDVGISSLGDETNPNQYGLSLTLGAGEVYLLEWANAYATVANGGTYRETYAIERIERDGVVIEGYPHEVSEGEQVLDPGNAYLLQSILSDKEARIPAFGQNTPLSPTYPAGAKTGTTNDFRDNWTMGFTTEIAVGVWVGNTDNSPMINVTGVTGAGPIWRGVMDGAAQWYPPREFEPRPDANVFPQNVCVDDGALPSEYCSEHSSVRTELFVADPPPAESGLYRELAVDTFTGLVANEYCSEFTREEVFLALPDTSPLIDMRAFIREWLMTTDRGRAWLAERGISDTMLGLDPPEDACGPDVPQPTLVLTSPEQGSTQGHLITVLGSADAPNFSHYRVEFGVSHAPEAWGIVQGDTATPVRDGVLGQVNLSAFEDGPMSIRVIVFDTEGHSAERRVNFMLVKPTPEPTTTPMPTATPTPTPTPTSTPTPTATPTDTAPVVIPTDTEEPTTTP